MDREPARQRADGEHRQDGDDAGPVAKVVAGDEADARACGDEAAVGDLVVGAQREVAARENQPHARGAADDRVVAVEADQAMRGEVFRHAQRRRLGEIALVRGGDDLDLAELPRDQRLLHRPHHAHRDVGFAAQQVGELVRGDQLDLDLRMLALQAQQHLRQQPGRRDLARRDADDAARQRARARQAAAERERGVFHAPGSVDDGERGAGRRRRRGRCARTAARRAAPRARRRAGSASADGRRCAWLPR